MSRPMNGFWTSVASFLTFLTPSSTTWRTKPKITLLSQVLIVGLGALGCPSSHYLAAAGVGTLGLVDDDVVDVSNLHRQVDI